MVGRRLHDATLVLAPLVTSLALYVVHLTDAYEHALRSRWFHEGQHVIFLGAGAALWATVLSSGRRQALVRVGSLVGASASMALLGMILTTMDRSIASSYVEIQGAEAALDDQRLGASLMWVGGMAVTAPIVVLAIWRWAASEDYLVNERERLEVAARQSSASRRSTSAAQ